MKTYLVTLALIIGYYDEDYNEPKLYYAEHLVQAHSEDDAKRAARQMDKTSYSVYESYAEEI